MKTINKALALLISAVAFTACTDQSIEPMRTTTQPQSMIVRPDTTYSSDRITLENNEQLTYERHGKVTLTENVEQATPQPTTVEAPASLPKPHVVPRDEPHQTVMPVVHADASVY